MSGECGNNKHKPSDPGSTFQWPFQVRAARYRLLDMFLLPGLYERKPRRDFLTKTGVQYRRQKGYNGRSTDGFVNIISEAPKTHRIVRGFVKFPDGSIPQVTGSSRLDKVVI